MGYTHYYSQTREIIAAADWAAIRADIGEIIKHTQTVQGVALADGEGNGGTAPEITPEYIMFNGVGESSAESFAIYRCGREPFYVGDNPFTNFCKTYQRPYDIAVTASLCYLASVARTYNATSDGSARDWMAGLEMARLALPQYANLLDYPRGLLEEDRWCAPWVRCAAEAPRHAFRFCVDGHAYVIDEKSGDCYRFDTHREGALWLRQNAAAKGEPDIWFASGWFDAARNAKLARLQSRRLGELVRLASSFGRDHKPPAFVRPGDFPQFEDAPRPYTIEALIVAAT